MLKRHEIDLVAMAGFMTILEHPIHDVYGGMITNTHPSLLPAFKGWHAVEDALAAGVKVTGCTVHIATLDLDNGPILAQEPVAVLPGDTRRDAARARQGSRAAPLPAGTARHCSRKGSKE